jgi:hypothetical protein
VPRRIERRFLVIGISETKSPAYSKKLNGLFNEAITLLSMHPQIGRKTNLEGIHVKIVRDYLIVYEVSGIEIIIHTIWDGRRNPDDLGVL